MKELKLFDEQKIKKLKKAAAVGAVFVTLGSGAAEAMPGGATLETGSVSVTHQQGGDASLPGQDRGLTNGDTLTVTNGPAVINWTTFNIGSTYAESLTIDTSNGALLNRVSNEVTITNENSTINQIGANPCWIVSEKGITVSGGTITGNNLVFSTIPIATADFIAVANGTKTFNVVGTAKTNPNTGGNIGISGMNVGQESVGPNFVQLADSIIVESLSGGAFEFTEVGQNEIILTVNNNINDVLGAGNDTAAGIGTGAPALQGNGQPVTVSSEGNPAAVETVLSGALEGGAGQVRGSDFTLGKDGQATHEEDYVAVGDVDHLVGLSVWPRESSQPADGADHGKQSATDQAQEEQKK